MSGTRLRGGRLTGAGQVATVAVAVAGLVAVLVLGFGSLGSGSGKPVAAPAAAARAAYGKLPLRFEPNRGQTDRRVRFVSRGAGYSLFLTSREAVLSLRKPAASPGSRSRHRGAGVASAVVRMRPVGANPSPRVEGAARLGGQSNYVIGNDPRRWHTGVPGYGEVAYRGVYPGIDLVYHGAQGRLEYDFKVAAGADPGRVALAFSGVKRLSLDARGDLVAHTAAGSIRQHAPVVSQQVGASRRAVPARFVLQGRDRVAFSLGAYDRSRPLLIDPVLSYSTYLGGPPAPGLDRDLQQAGDQGYGIAVDKDGSAYVTGVTGSAAFPTKNAYQADEKFGELPGDSGTDAFVTKLTPDGKHLVYSTYLGGYNRTTNQNRQPEYAGAIAVDASGNAFVTGSTPSANFPTTPGAHKPVNTGGREAFVAKFDANGGLAYSTLLGGTGDDLGTGIGVRGGSIFVTGTTAASDFPTTPSADKKDASPGFVARLEPDDVPGDSDISYSSYLRGRPTGIAVDGAGSVYVTGSAGASSPIAPTAGAHQPSLSGGSDAFVTKLTPDDQVANSDIAYSSYLGGTSNESASGIAVDGSGDVYVVGLTASADFPRQNAAQPAYGGAGDAFVSKLRPDTVAGDSDLAYSSYLGGSGFEGASVDLGSPAGGIAVDSSGRAYVVGATRSADFPIKDPVQATAGGGVTGDAFVARFAVDGGLDASTYLGGHGGDAASAVALDAAGSAYVTGWTDSQDFAVSDDAFQSKSAGYNDAFVTKLSATSAPTVAGVQPRGGSRRGGSEVTITGARFTGATAVRFGDTAAQFTVVSDSEIVASSPSHADGDVSVTVAGPQGASAPSRTARYFFHGWAKTGELSAARFGHTATLLANGKVLVTGGCEPRRAAPTDPPSCAFQLPPLKTAELYDPKAGTWSSAGEMASPRFGHTATLLPNGKVLVMGGLNRFQSSSVTPGPVPLATVEIYDPQSNGWSAPATLREGRFGHTATLLPNGKVLLVGGVLDERKAANGGELYDPGSRDSTLLTGAPALWRFHTATLLPSGPSQACGSNCGKVLVVGLQTGGGGGTEAYLYDPTFNAFSLIPGPNTRRISHTATLLSSGRVLVVGGRGNPDATSSSTGLAEVFDPAAPAAAPWRYVATVFEPRKGHAAALLPDGKVLIAGGSGGVADLGASSPFLLPTSRLFDETAGSGGSGAWVTPGLMSVNREIYNDADDWSRVGGSTATLLSSDPGTFKADRSVCGENCGKILVLGGSAEKSAELYTPPGSGDGSSGDGDTTGSSGDAPASGVATTPATGGPQIAGNVPVGPAPDADSRRAVNLRSCLARVARHAKAEQSRARRGFAGQRRRAATHIKRHAASGRGRCLRLYGRTPGAVTGLQARAVSQTKIELSFRAPGTDGSKPPAARSYLVRQPSKPIGTHRAFGRAQALCNGACRFSVTRVGTTIMLIITDLRPHSTYYYAIAARDNVSSRLGPRSRFVSGRTS